MFATFDFSKFDTQSIISVKLNSSINDEGFQDFINKWMSIYEYKKDFSFIFDCSNVGYVPIKYCFQMTAFIKNLKEQEYQFLQKSIMYVNNKSVKILLDIVFAIQPPVAPVYIIDNKDYISEILENKINEQVITILPGKSFLNIF